MDQRPSLKPRDQKYKVVLLGESGVGKSSLVHRITTDEWKENLNSTVGASFMRFSIRVQEKVVQFDLWDTAGQERYRSLASMYYRGAAAAVVVFDITDEQSFHRAKYWVTEVSTMCPETVIALVANKADLSDSRAVSSAEVLQYTTELDLMLHEVSAKSGVGVHGIFESLALRVTEHERQQSATATEVRGTVALGEAAPDTQPSTCC